jgi:alpha-ribazole phosphatase
MRLYLVRHPKPRHAIGLCYGRRDVTVDRESLAHAVGAVRECLPQQVLRAAPIFSSPSMRCVALARELAAPGEPMLATDLVEISFGSWEGRPWDALPRDELDAWAADVWRYKPGGAESALMVAQRWDRWSTGIRQSADGAAMTMAVAVTHAGFIRVALACAGGLDARSFSRAPIDFGSVHCIDLAANDS